MSTQDTQDTQVRTDYSPQTQRRLGRLALLLAALLVIGFVLVFAWRRQQNHALSAAADEARQPPTVNVTRIHAGIGAGSLTLPGQSAAWYESTIYARVSGYVAKWNADIGDHVRQGQTLALIDTPELDAQLSAARAQLNAAEAQVNVRQAEAELATTTWQRWRESPKGVVSDQEREEKKADYDSAEARLTAARAQVALNQADVDHYIALTQFKRVTAPFDGTVVERRIDIGNLVTAGSTAATQPLYRLTQDRPIRIFVDVPQSASAELMKPGAAAEVRAASLAGRTFAGKVTRTAEAIDPQARTLRVEVDLPNGDGSLVPGMYVDVDFHLADTGTPQVPAAAIVFRSAGPQVAVVDADGHLHFRAVTIARDNGSVVELISGVHDGDRVALNVSSRIADGEAVVAQETDATRPVADAATRDGSADRAAP